MTGPFVVLPSRPRAAPKVIGPAVPGTPRAPAAAPVPPAVELAGTSGRLASSSLAAAEHTGARRRPPCAREPQQDEAQTCTHRTVRRSQQPVPPPLAVSGGWSRSHVDATRSRVRRAERDHHRRLHLGPTAPERAVGEDRMEDEGRLQAHADALTEPLVARAPPRERGGPATRRRVPPSRGPRLRGGPRARARQAADQALQP